MFHHSCQWICSNIWGKNTQTGCMFSHSHQWFQSTQRLKRDSHTECMFTLFSHSCQWFWSAQTLKRDSLPECMSSHSSQWFWSAQTLTHILDPCSVILVIQIYSNTEEGLTSWIHVQPSQSLVLICKTLKNYSQAGYMFSHSHQCFWSSQEMESNSPTGCMLSQSSVILISPKHWRVTHILDACSVILISSSDLLKY